MDVIGIVGVLLSLLIAVLFAATVIDAVWRNGIEKKQKANRHKKTRRHNREAAFWRKAIAFSRKRTMVLRQNKLARRNYAKKDGEKEQA